MRDVDTSRISPTAHYTGYVWTRNALSHPRLATRRGAVLFHAARPLMWAASHTLEGLTLEKMLLARHRGIDERLASAIEAGRIGQVIEIAGGLSGRGYRFVRRFRDRRLVYVEGDLPAMAERKRRLLGRAGIMAPHHHVVSLNVLLENGAQSLNDTTEPLLDPRRGTAIVTEGLVNYFDRADVLAMWRRFATTLATYPRGLYLSDLHLREPLEDVAAAQWLQWVLRIVAGGDTHLQFANASAVAAACEAAGFASAQLQAPALVGPEVVTVLEAWTATSASDAPAEGSAS